MINIGTKVEVLPNCGYDNRLSGCVGIVKKNSKDKTVKKIYKDKIGVQFDGCKNPYSEYGLFWFRENCLEAIPDISCAVDDAIKQVVYSGPKTIILWTDGSKTIVSCSLDDTFDPYIGFCAAVTKKVFGSTSKIKKIIDCCTKDGNKYVHR